MRSRFERAFAMLLVVGGTSSCSPFEAGESSVIGDMRAVISAQAAYASVNGGFYDGLGCLQAPASCLGEHDGPPFLDERLAALPDLDGYARRFYPGPAAPAEEVAAAGASGTSITSWALLAVPFGSQDREPPRSFCADDTGAIRFAQDPMIPVLGEGRCPEDWAPLQ